MSTDQHQTAEMNYEFTIGEFHCAVVSDGSFAYPNPSRLFFVNAEPDELAAALKRYDIDPDTWEQYVSPYPCLVVQTGEKTVLVDTGGGALGEYTGKLQTNLHHVGISPETIDIVLLTHIHPDHVGGNINQDGTPAFPNADYLVSRTEAEFWLNDPDLSSLKVPAHIKEVMVEFADKQIRPLGDRLKRIDGGTELVPGIQLILAPGHTPGHLAVEVSSLDESLLYLVDLVFQPIHIEHPEWHTAFDIDPKTTVESRRQLLDRAADLSTLVMAQHFPAPGLGRVSRTDTSYEWAPISDE